MYKCVVWCGVVWCGVVLCGVVWCGVVLCGVALCGVVWCGAVGCGVVWCGAVWSRDSRAEREVVQLVVLVDGIVLAQFKELLQRLVDEDDADERGEGLLREAR